MNKNKIKNISPLMSAILVILAIYVVIMISILVWGVLASLKTVFDFKDNPGWFPKDSEGWQWGNYPKAFELFKVKIGVYNPRYVFFPEMFFNSVLYAIGCSFSATMTPCVAAYLTAKFPYKFSKIVYFTVIVAMALPIIGNLPSEIQIVRALGFYDSMIGIWIMTAHFLGMYFLVFYATFNSVPRDFSDAAAVDGASNWMVFTRIMLPLVRNAFFTIMLLKFIEYWNNYQTPMIYLPTWPTASYGLYHYNFGNDGATSWAPMRITGSIILMSPILVIFSLFHNKIIGNISMGGIKG